MSTINFTEEMNKPKLGFDFFNNLISKSFKNYIIKSDTGTGKSTSIKHFLKSKNHKFISLTSRKTLAQEHFRIFNEFKLDCQLYTDKLKPNISTVIQVESINKLFYIIQPNTIKNYVLILDEVSSFIKHILTSPTVKNKRKTLGQVILLLKNCKYVVAVDADINEPVKYLFDYIKTPTQYIKNNYQNNKDVKAFELGSYDELTEKLLNLKKFMVCCDSANKAKELYKILDDENIKLITSEINLTNEIYNLDNYQKVIFSPKIIYGLDSTIKRDVFCYYTGQTLDSRAMYQQLSRTRNIENLFIYFTQKPKQNKQFENFEDVKEQTKIYNQWFQLMAEEMHNSPLDSLIDMIKNHYDYEQDLDKADVFKNFIELLKSKGFIVELNNNTEKGKRKTRKDLLDEYHQEIFDFETNRINKYMKLSEDVATQNIDLLSNGYAFRNHINICKWLTQSYKELKSDFYDKVNFYLPSELAKSDLNKFRLLYKLLKITKSTKEKISIKENIDESLYQQIQNDYKICFPRGTVEISKNNDVMKVILNLIKDLFNDEIYQKRQEQINGIRTMSLKIKNEMVKHHLKLAEYRKNNNSEFTD